MKTLDKVQAPLKKSLLAGSGWMVALRLSMRIFGFGSIIVLARILTPEDFGLIAMCSVIAAFSDLLFSFGVDVVLIQKSEVTDADLNAAWSLQILQGAGAAFVITTIAPFAVDFYNDARVLPILLLMAAGVLARGFKNTGVIFFKRELQFNRQYNYQIIITVIRIIVTILAALALRSYWALVLGIVIGYFLEVFFSFMLHKFRPKFRLEGIRDIWSFSKWVIVLRLAQFFSLRFDRIILGGLTTSSKVGIYNMSNEIAAIPNETVMGPVQQVLFPGFSKLKYEESRLNTAYLKSLAAATSIGLPACIGVGLVAEELVPIMLGSQWLDAIPLIQILAFSTAARSLTLINGAIMMAADMIKPLSVIYALSALIYLLSMVSVYQVAELEGVAQLRAIFGVLTLAALIYFVSKKREIAFTKVWSIIWRPLVSTIAMFLGVNYFALILQGDVTIWMSLVAKVSAGAAIYASVLMFLWCMSGRPKTIEADIISMLSKKL
jgi:polysaccharide transporter, PST family